MLYGRNKTFSSESVSQDPNSKIKQYFENEENNDLHEGQASGKYRVIHFATNAFAGIEFGRIYLTANYSKGLNEFYEENGK